MSARIYVQTRAPNHTPMKPTSVLKIPAVPTRRDRESSTVRKFAIFRYARIRGSNFFSSQRATQFIRFSECLKKGPGGLGIAYGMDLNIRFFEQFCGPPIGAHGF